MLSQTEPWAEDSDSSSADGEDALLGGEGWGVTYRPPRLCRIVSASRVRSFETFQAACTHGKSGPGREGVGGALGGDDENGALEADWVNVQCTAGKALKPELRPLHDHMWVDNKFRFPENVFGDPLVSYFRW